VAAAGDEPAALAGFFREPGVLMMHRVSRQSGPHSTKAGRLTPPASLTALRQTASKDEDVVALAKNPHSSYSTCPLDGHSTPLVSA